MKKFSNFLKYLLFGMIAIAFIFYFSQSTYEGYRNKCDKYCENKAKKDKKKKKKKRFKLPTFGTARPTGRR